MMYQVKLDPTLDDFIAREGDTLLVNPACPPDALAAVLTSLSSHSDSQDLQAPSSAPASRQRERE